MAFITLMTLNTVLYLALVIQNSKGFYVLPRTPEASPTFSSVSIISGYINTCLLLSTYSHIFPLIDKE